MKCDQCGCFISLMLPIEFCKRCRDVEEDKRQELERSAKLMAEVDGRLATIRPLLATEKV